MCFVSYSYVETLTSSFIKYLQVGFMVKCNFSSKINRLVIITTF